MLRSALVPLPAGSRFEARLASRLAGHMRFGFSAPPSFPKSLPLYPAGKPASTINL